MIRDITLGQYYYTDSIIHKLDPRTKILGTLVYIISLFLFNNMIVYIVPALFFVMVVFMSKVPFWYVVRGLKPVVVLLLFTGALNLFLTPGRELISVGIITITYEGINKFFYISLRLILLMLGSEVMTLTTTPNQLTDGFERVLAPLKLIRVPVPEIAMMMTIALRFIPILVEEVNRIMKAQASRGADFESGNIIQKLKSVIPILVPLFASALGRAGDLAMAMEARCYHGGNGRTKMHPLKYKLRDFISFIVFILYIAAIIVSGKVVGLFL